MANVKAANITKFDNGGSGDNYIPDGYIKSVEKVWIDSYAIGTTNIGSDDTIKIGRVLKGKKITDVIVATPSLMSAASNTTIYIGSGTTMAVDGGYLGALQPDGVAAGTYTFDSNKAQTSRLQGAYHATQPDKDVDLYMKISVSGGVDTNVTAGTIKTIIKYT